MSKEKISPVPVQEQEDTRGEAADLNLARQSRRGFIGMLGLGAVAVTGLSAPFWGILRRRGSQQTARDQEFPGPDSIFHPARDPRLDPRRKGGS